MSCGELGKGAKTWEAVEVCCGEFETCREACVVRAGLFKWQRDGLLKAAEAAMQIIGEMGPSRPRVEAFVMLQDAIASVKGGS